MSSFGQIIEKAKDEDKEKIIEVMESTLKKTKKDTITKAMIENVKEDLKKLQGAMPANSWEAASILFFQQQKDGGYSLDYIQKLKSLYFDY